MLLLPNNSLVLRAFSTLANAAPGKTNYDYHLSYVKDFGSAGYVSALNQIFANVSDTDLATLTLNNLGLNSVFSVDTAKAFIAGNAANRVGAVLNLADAVSNYAGSDAALLAAKTAYNNKLDYSFNYSTVASNLLPSNFPDSIDLTTFNLTTAIDNLVGTSGNDFFKAYLSPTNTLNSGDIIKGGLGFDTLYADISTTAAITPETTGVEYVQLRAEHKSTDSTDNNTSLTNEVQIDAQRMQGVTTWENNNSRADLLIEDVRIAANQITKDITIAMVETDPGHVDFGVYFDQLSLRNQTATTSVLSLELLDTRSKAAGTGPLKDNPYNGFGFLLNGQAVVVQSDAIDAALTYADLRTAIENRINELKATNPALANFTVTLGTDFNRYDTESGQLVTGTKILLTDTAGGVITLNPSVGWVTATGTVPPSSGLHTNISNAATTSTDLVTSKVILDDVGRGSTGGDLVIGGLSVGDTSTSKGVQRFEIEVRDNSKLQTINSTNNTLQEVTIKNGATSSNSTAYTTTVKDAGNLTVNGSVSNVDGDATNTDTQNEALPGTLNQHNAFGFSDVRLIDGSAMTGKLEFTAEITAASKAKYLNLVDVAANAPAADNVAFVYSGGSANDTMKVTIDGAVAGSTNTLGAREDFTFTLNGGAGDDKLTLNIDKSGSAAWYVDQAALDNVTINGGDGNDTINKPGSGDVIINAGAGTDTVYTDNSALDVDATHGHATWVVSSTAADGGAVALLNDLQGVPANNTDIFLYKGKLTVTFSGDSSTDASGGVTGVNPGGVAAAGTNGWEVTVDIPTGSNYAVNQMYLNQAIKLAINSDPVLSKLLLAQDGPLNTLTIKSLIDGTFLNDDLLLSVSGVDVTTLSATEQTSVLTAYKAFAHNSAAVIATAQAAQAASVIDLNNNEGMSTGQVLITNGDQSTALTDNVIDLGTGNDVLALSSSASANETLVFKGYDLGKDTVVNFEDGTNVVASLDKLDFTSYLNNKQSLSGSTESQTRIATSLNGDAITEANSVTVLAAGLNFNDTTAKFSELTAAKLLAAINSTNTGSADYAGITAASLNALTTYTSSGAPTTLVGGVGKAVVLVENDDNKGEYAAFELTFNGLATNATADFTAATLIGTVDFGTSVTFTNVLI